MHTAVQVFAIVQFAVIGLSHVLAPRAWAEFFVLLRERGHAGVFVIAFLSLAFGSVVVAFHPVWSGIPLVLTLFGWAHVAKAAVYFLFPALGLRALGVISIERAGRFIWAGIALIAVAALLLFHVSSQAAG